VVRIRTAVARRRMLAPRASRAKKQKAYMSGGETGKRQTKVSSFKFRASRRS
jgi:hypothetical protein